MIFPLVLFVAGITSGMFFSFFLTPQFVSKNELYIQVLVALYRFAIFIDVCCNLVYTR